MKYSLCILMWLFLHGVTVVFVHICFTTTDAEATVATAKMTCMLLLPEAIARVTGLSIACNGSDQSRQRDSSNMSTAKECIPRSEPYKSSIFVTVVTVTCHMYSHMWGITP